MEDLIKEHEKLSTVDLSKCVESIDALIQHFQEARDAIAADPHSATVTLNKLGKPMKEKYDAAKSRVREVYGAHLSYQKKLDARFKEKPIPTSDNDALSSQSDLINRAIGMHLLREGQFNVASQFLKDTQAKNEKPDIGTDTTDATMDEALGVDTLRSDELRDAFANMYHILHELRSNQNLLPAIRWARENSEKLELRGSNLEYELGQLQFINLFTGHLDDDSISASKGRFEALNYAQQNFSHFQERYLNQISELASCLIFSGNLGASPYRQKLLSPDTWRTVAEAFTKEFCSLLGLSASSPLYIAATAGAIALPTLLKLQTIMKDKRAEWTTQQELPVEIPLPSSYLFHSIFVCPVSKEQTTDENPPMMMPCGHVVAQESLARLAKGARFKCPYCPLESRPAEALKLYL